MVTTVGMQKDYLQALQSLLELEYDACEAYKAALNRLSDAAYKQQVELFYRDHTSHIEELHKILQNYEVKIPESPTLKSILTQGKVVIGGLVNDASVLRAMLSNEEDTNTAYKRLNEYKEGTPQEKGFLAKALEDEKRHKAWFQHIVG